MKYVKSLDGLRALAVLLVIFRHWHLPFLNVELGWIGVNVFFVLSGFLISSILLEDKKVMTFKKFIKIFFIKRTLRIFPLYFIYIAVAGVLLFVLNTFFEYSAIQNGLVHLGDSWHYIVTYTYNFSHLGDLLSNTAAEGTKFFGHLWSLAVEEQFYLIFPFIAFFLNKRQLRIGMIVIIVLVPVLRGVMGTYFLSHYNDPSLSGLVIYKSTFFQLDSLATGILLSTVSFKDVKWSNAIFFKIGTSLLGVLLLIVMLLRYYGVDINYTTLSFQLANKQIQYSTGTLLDYYYTISFTLLNILAAFLILSCMMQTKAIQFLAHNFLVKIGKISYGIYILHNGIYVLFTLVLFTLIGEEFVRENWWVEIIAFIVFLSLVYITANLSYRYIEKPFLKIKSRLTSNTLIADEK